MARVLSDDQDAILAHIFRLYREGFFERKPRGGRAAAEFVVYRATTIQEHAPGEMWPVQLCDSSWAAISGETPDALNESQTISIPSGVRLYCCPGGDESLLILTPLDCFAPS